MYTLEDITKIFDVEDHTTEDGFNAIKTTLLSKLSESLGEHNSLLLDNKALKEENDRLKNANTMLYSQIEKQFVDKSKGTDTTETESETLDDDVDEGEKVLEEQIKLYGGLE